MATAFAIHYRMLVAVVVLLNCGRAGTCHRSDSASLRLHELSKACSSGIINYNESQDQMEAIKAQPAKVVAQVLPSSKFLRNVGLEPTFAKRSATAVACVQELEIEVAAEKQGVAALRDQLHGQQDELDVLKKVVESEEAREK
ncbi:unnamed protein product [Miscanthus lutarioriparius]|uniref:Uncharacterized protein n=1 Tax=Miscanthus lutarioriparius TaxID=422564 RepID=A0A811QEJ8_9POAL|nr:unnamed protein product [Miscanthus lutarioriparius]